MRRQRDWYDQERDEAPARRRGPRRESRHQAAYPDEFDGSGHTGEEVRGRYLREAGPGRAGAVHWQPVSHLPGSDPYDGGYGPVRGDAGGAPWGRRGYGDRAYGRGFDGSQDQSGQGADSGPGGGRHSYRGLGPRGYVRTDARILEDLCERLSDDPVVDARDIEVRCEDGCVALAGTVPGRWMKHRAEDIADSVSGVQDIDNRIRVMRGKRQGGEGREPDDGDAAPDGRGTPPQQPH